MSASIKAISYYLPEKTLTNADLVAQFPHLTEDEIFRSTGVRKRHIAIPDDRSKDLSGSDVGFLSAEKFFAEHPHKKEEIDFLLFCTEGLDYKAPTTAAVLQHKLQLPKQCGAIDIPNGCTGFMYGLSVAKGLIASKQAHNVLLITSEVPSYVIHPDDYELRAIFGDGAATTLISGNYEEGISSFVFGTDGSGAENLIIRSSAIREPIDEVWLEKYKNEHGLKYGRMEMNGQEIFIFAMRVVPPMVRELLQKNNLSADDIDLYIFHQANGFLLKVLQKKLRIPEDKFYVYLENVGNTVSATIPIALKEAIKEGKAKKGDKILLAGFGVGYSWAGTIITL